MTSSVYDRLVETRRRALAMELQACEDYLVRRGRMAESQRIAITKRVRDEQRQRVVTIRRRRDRV